MEEEELDILLDQLIELLQETRHESKALRALLVEKTLLSEQEINDQIEEITLHEWADVKSEALRRSYEKLLKSRPTQ